MKNNKGTLTQTNLGIELEEVREESVETKLSRLNISSFEHTFENFDKVAGAETAYDIFRKLGEGESDRKFILCFGGYGCGKTYLIEATIIAWAKRGIRSRYQTMSQLMRYLKRCMGNGHIPPYDTAFEAVCSKTQHLIIDDVGMGTIESKWEIAELEDIINERYNKRYYDDGKVTILASNKNINKLPDRVVSRFYDPEFGAVILNEAKDYRKRKV